MSYEGKAIKRKKVFSAAKNGHEWSRTSFFMLFDKKLLGIFMVFNGDSVASRAVVNERLSESEWNSKKNWRRCRNFKRFEGKNDECKNHSEIVSVRER
jgi:hypothetical protein